MYIRGKIFLLFLCLLALIVFSVYTYDYNSVLNNNEIKNQEKPNVVLKEYKEKIFNAFYEIKNSLLGSNKNKELKKVSPQKENTFNSLKIIKKDENLYLEGIFKDEQQAQEIAKFLNVQLKNQELKKGIEKNIHLLIEVQLILPSFKNNFANGSEILVKGEKIIINAILNDRSDEKTFKKLLTGIDVAFNIKKVLEEKKDIAKDTKENTEIKIVENKEVEKKEVKNKEINTKQEKTKDKKETKNISDTAKIQNEINAILAKHKITFKRASYKLMGASYKSVKKIAKILKKYPKIKVEIGGHTDSKGRASLNKKISQKRANRIMKAFIDFRIDPSRLSAVGYGEEFPIAKEDKKGLSEKNRRVEIKIIGKIK